MKYSSFRPARVLTDDIEDRFQMLFFMLPFTHYLLGCCDISINTGIFQVSIFRYLSFRCIEISKISIFFRFFDKKLFFNDYIIIIMTFKLLL